jgi:hypothetical protein
MKRYIVCIPFLYAGKQTAHPYSIEAGTPKLAARLILNSPQLENSKININGRITVCEAKAGRLDVYFKFYDVKDLS